MWGLEPQPPKPQYEKFIKESHPKEWRAEHFGDSKRVDLGDGKYYMAWTWHDFKKGVHITWQQRCILEIIRRHVESVEKVKYGKLLKELLGYISVASGHGIGKSACLSWIILWFLFCFPECQVAATAPSKQQIFDILWKEIHIWLGRMPEVYRKCYDWQSSYVRMTTDPESWFARAATARKENPEALAGVHGEHVLLVADEASGVEQVIFETAEGATTGGHVMFIMISNPTRNTGYFKESHAKNAEDWENMSFNCEESPVVDISYVEKMSKKYDRNSDNFRMRVLGLFPHTDQIDEKGYMPLLTEAEIRNAFVPRDTPFKASKMGVDPAGQGGDKATWIGGSSSVLKILAEENVSTPISGSQKTLTLSTEHELTEDDIELDAFGEGMRWIQPLAAAGLPVKGLNSGDPSTDSDYMNLRAEGAWKLRQFIKNGGQMVEDERWLEIVNIKYRRTTRGKIQIMPKIDMKKQRIPSPNIFDGACYVFLGKPVEDSANKGSKQKKLAQLKAMVAQKQMSRFG